MTSELRSSLMVEILEQATIAAINNRSLQEQILQPCYSSKIITKKMTLMDYPLFHG